jgi:hypothetical protein
MYQGGPPQITPPGLAAATFAGSGVGASYGTAYSQQAAYGGLSGQLAGAQAMNFVGNTAIPATAMAAEFGLFAAGPLMEHGLQAGSRAQMLGASINKWDPFSVGLRRGASAWRGSAGLTQGASMVGRGAGYAARGARALTAAAPPIALGMLAMEGVIQSGKQMYQGAQRRMEGATLMNDIGGQFGGGASNSSDIGRLLQDTGRGIGKDVAGMADMVRDMDKMKMFQATRDIKEFKTRFKEIMDTVKEVATTMQTTVDDALGMVGEMRTQGFYTTSDIKSGALRQQARGEASGLGTGAMMQAGRFGTQYARALGMRGRFGSDMAQQSTAAVGYAMRQGIMSEEEVMERGGVAQVGANLAAKQMRFMSSGRGRMMIANMMGDSGYGMDMDRVNNVLSGNMGLEGMVTGGAGRGLGVLGRAGDPRARENAMQYAGMGMVATAAAQARQLNGGVNERSLYGMLGTMGVGRQDAQLLIQQTMAMPGMLDAQATAESSAMNRGAWEQSRQYNKFGSKVGRYFSSRDTNWAGKGWGRALQNFGDASSGAVSRGWKPIAEAFGRPVESTGGGSSDFALAAAYSARPGREAPALNNAQGDMGFRDIMGDLNFNPLGNDNPWTLGRLAGSSWDTGPMFGGARTQDQRLRTTHSSYTMGAQEAMRSGSRTYDAKANAFIRHSDIARGNRANEQGRNISNRQRSLINRFVSGSDGGGLVGHAEDIINNGVSGWGNYFYGQETDAFKGLNSQEQDVFTIATAIDQLAGDAGNNSRTNILGSYDTKKYGSAIEAYADDSDEGRDYRTRVAAALGTNPAMESIVGRRESTGLFSPNEAEAGDAFHLLLEKGNRSGHLTALGGMDEESFGETLVRSEKTRGMVARYLEVKARQAAGEDVSEDLALIEGEMMKDDQAKFMVTEARESSSYDRWLQDKEGGGQLLEGLQYQAYKETRERGQSSIIGRAKKSQYSHGKEWEDRIGALTHGGTVEDYGRAVEDFAMGMTSGGIDDKELAVLEDVLGGKFGAMATQLAAGDEQTQKDLRLSDEQVNEIASAGSEEAKIAKIIEIMADKGMLEAFGSAGGTEIGDTRTEYVQANSRFVAAVNRFVSNLKGDLGDDWKPIDLED